MPVDVNSKVTFCTEVSFALNISTFPQRLISNGVAPIWVKNWSRKQSKPIGLMEERNQPIEDGYVVGTYCFSCFPGIPTHKYRVKNLSPSMLHSSGMSTETSDVYRLATICVENCRDKKNCFDGYN